MGRILLPELNRVELTAAVTEGARRTIEDVFRADRRRWAGDRWSNDINAAIAEASVAKWRGRYWTLRTYEERHLGDLAGGVDVKWTPYVDGRLIIDPKSDLAASLILVAGSYPEMYFCGWAFAGDGPERGEWMEAWRNPCFAIPQERLRVMPETENEPCGCCLRTDLETGNGLCGRGFECGPCMEYATTGVDSPEHEDRHA